MLSKSSAIQFKSTIHQAQDFPPAEDKSQFCKFTCEMGKRLRSGKLSGAEWSLWAYLTTLNPFGDQYIRLPDMHVVLAECDMSKATLYRAMARLQELELFDFQDEIMFSNRQVKSSSRSKKVAFSTSLKNETPVSNLRNQSQICDSSLKNETPVSNLRKSSAETSTGKDSQNPSDSPDSKIFKTTDNSVVAGQKKAEEEKEEEGDTEPKVSREELDAAMTQLRAIGVKLNQTVRSTVGQNYAKVDGAIAHIKERLAAGEQFRCLEAAFVKACKNAAKPEGVLKPGLPVEKNPPSLEQLEQLEKAKIAGTISDYYFSGDGITKVVMPNRRDQQLWWEFLEISS